MRADGAAFVDWVCRGEVRTPCAGVMVTVAGAVVFLRLVVAAGARAGLVTPPPVPPQGATIVDGERGVDVILCKYRVM